MTLLKAGNREHRNTLNESPSEKEGKFCVNSRPSVMSSPQ